MYIFKNYIRSFSTQLGFIAGGLYYVAYATPNKSWNDPYLICVSIFFAFFLPYYSKLSNQLDELTAYKTASVFLGKVSRFGAQNLFNMATFYVLLHGKSIQSDNITCLGGIYGLAFLISLTSQGIQYLAITLANRDIGNKNLNITVGVTINILLGACAAHGFEYGQLALKILGLILGIVGLLYGLYTDVLGVFAPAGGIGIFFGTFNPAHKTHARMIKKFLEERQLEKVIIHPTIIPKVHRLALQKGQIRVKQIVNGMRIYETTDQADVHVNYFQTGNKFYEVEHRVKMLKEMVREEGLEKQVEVWSLDDCYNKGGFYAVVAEIRRRFPGKRLHGLHGSDVGGMLVRSIYDESMGIIPYAVRRVDDVSATAIRNGARGMTSESVNCYLEQLQTIN